MRYYKDLDGVRAVAVFLVVFRHWVPAYGKLTNPVLGFIGAMGVNTFFVLSGFLISGILFQYRDSAYAKETSRFENLKIFYARRALRIFPVFYLLLIILFISSFFTQQLTIKELVFDAFYVANFYVRHVREWTLSCHFWSLAVEEQFYLIWPLILLFLNRSFTFPAILIFITIGVISQCIYYDEFDYLMPYTCFDSFGIGALIAWVNYSKIEMIEPLKKVIYSVALLSAGFITYGLLTGVWYNLPTRFMQSSVAAALLVYLVSNAEETTTLVNRFFRNKAVSYFGLVSYGIYLFHPFINAVYVYTWMKIFRQPYLTVDQPLFYLMFLIQLVVVIIVASLSWKYFERPLLTLKKYFPGPGDKFPVRNQMSVSTK